MKRDEGLQLGAVDLKDLAQVERGPLLVEDLKVLALTVSKHRPNGEAQMHAIVIRSNDQVQRFPSTTSDFQLEGVLDPATEDWNLPQGKAW